MKVRYIGGIDAVEIQHPSGGVIVVADGDDFETDAEFGKHLVESQPSNYEAVSAKRSAKDKEE